MKNKPVHFVKRKKLACWFYSHYCFTTTACGLGYSKDLGDIRGTENRHNVTCKNCLRVIKAKERDENK